MWFVISTVLAATLIRTTNASLKTFTVSKTAFRILTSAEYDFLRSWLLQFFLSDLLKYFFSNWITDVVFTVTAITCGSAGASTLQTFTVSLQTFTFGAVTRHKFCFL